MRRAWRTVGAIITRIWADVEAVHDRFADLRCTDCAGGLGDFTCTRCGQEDWKHYRGVCGRCVLKDRLAVVLDDGTGQIRAELVPLFDLVTSMERPR
jgi:hypothetical protein